MDWVYLQSEHKVGFNPPPPCPPGIIVPDLLYFIVDSQRIPTMNPRWRRQTIGGPVLIIGFWLERSFYVISKEARL